MLIRGVVAAGCRTTFWTKDYNGFRGISSGTLSDLYGSGQFCIMYKVFMVHSFVLFHWQRFHIHGFLCNHPAPWAQHHRSITPKFVTPTALSCIDNSWRSTTLSPPTKLTSSTANLEWCHVHFIRDSYSTFIRRVIGPSKNSMELFCKAKFDFKSTWNRDSATSHHKHPVGQSPVRKAEKLTNVWWRYFGTNRIIDNWHRCLGVMWRKRKKYFDK